MTNQRSIVQQVALVGGPLVAIIVTALPAPEGLGADGWSVAAVCLLMAIWWMTEAIPLAITALLPLVLLPALGIISIDETAAFYSNPLIFLFLGGFIIARAMVKQHLSQRIAFTLLRLGSRSLSQIIAAIMIAAAFMSMWVNNTATTMMMLPIGQSIIFAVSSRVGEEDQPEVAKFSTALMLAIAYSATIGGMGTLIGTPPNALFAGYMRTTYGIEIEFWRWMLIGVPAVLILLPVTWFLLTKVLFKFSSSLSLHHIDFIKAEEFKLGRFTFAEIIVSLIAGGVALLWIFRDIISNVFPAIELSDAGIAIFGAFLLFVLPSKRTPGERILSWEDAKDIRWDILILFGGGLALAGSISSSGLAEWIGGIISVLDFLPTFLFLLGTFAVVVLLGELASNTAVAAIFLPIAGASAAGLGLEPGLLMMSVALAATIGFMMPVATPPNAIVFGSGALRIPDMLKAGAPLDAIGIVVVATLSLFVAPMIFTGL